VPVALGLERAAQRRGMRDRFEQERAPFFERVRECYLALARHEPQRIRVIDASRPLEAVHEAIGRILESLS
jgi:dTMP kinase